ncbi:MAG TPA: cytochrome P450 [Gammaproteobacteria bacterium]|nr:cytochrome P450 [Gammaproteobacteria bacterium]
MANHTSSTAAPPGPADKLDLQLDPASFPRIASLLRNHPDICRVPTLSRKADGYLLNHPDLIKRVLIDNHRNYVKGIGYERAKLLLGNGIIVSDGDFWKQQRRMVQPAFHRDMLKTLSSTIRTISLQWLERWLKLADGRQPFELNRAMSEFGLEVMLRSLFGDDLDIMIAEAGGNPFAIFTEEHERDLTLAVKFRALRQLVQRVITRRRERGLLPPDMLGALMGARDLEGRPMADKALIDELMTLIVAGHETSAITLTWMWYLLSQHPEVEARLHREVDALDPAQAAPDFAAAEKLVYCKQVMFETLRLYPPVWLFSRRALQDDTLGEYRIPGGSDLFISPYYLHRREDLWPDSGRFDPERFAEAEARQHHRTSFIPFSAGPRKCIGDVLSILEIQIHMGTIARRLVLRHVPDRPIELEPAINLRSRHPIRMIAETR